MCARKPTCVSLIYRTAGVTVCGHSNLDKDRHRAIAYTALAGNFINPALTDKQSLSVHGLLWLTLQFVVHSNLGKVVKEVVDEFRRNPPAPLPNSTTAARYDFSSL